MTDQFTVLHYDQIGSTSDEVRRLAIQRAPHGTVVHANEQTTGRGRRSHSWFSPVGNLYLSVLLRTGQLASRTPELSFLTAVAVAEAVEALLPPHTPVVLKWPNDVLVNHAKIAGILLEQAADAVIVGIGLNILHAPSNITYEATTIVANGGVASVDSARDIVLDRLGGLLSIWRLSGFEPIRSRWIERSYPLGTAIRANVGGGKAIDGRFAGLELSGALILDTPTGQQRVLAGEVLAVGDGP